MGDLGCVYCAWYIDRRHEEIDLTFIFPYKFDDIRLVVPQLISRYHRIIFRFKKITFQWKIDPKYKSFIILLIDLSRIGNLFSPQNPVAVLLISSSMNRVMNERTTPLRNIITTTRSWILFILSIIVFSESN